MTKWEHCLKERVQGTENPGSLNSSGKYLWYHLYEDLRANTGVIRAGGTSPWPVPQIHWQDPWLDSDRPRDGLPESAPPCCEKARVLRAGSGGECACAEAPHILAGARRRRSTTVCPAWPLLHKRAPGWWCLSLHVIWERTWSNNPHLKC